MDLSGPKATDCFESTWTADIHARYACFMADIAQLETDIREVLRDEMADDAERIERTVHRILGLVSPFEKAAQEELERYRETFAELAK